MTMKAELNPAIIPSGSTPTAPQSEPADIVAFNGQTCRLTRLSTGQTLILPRAVTDLPGGINVLSERILLNTYPTLVAGTPGSGIISYPLHDLYGTFTEYEVRENGRRVFFSQRLSSCLLYASERGISTCLPVLDAPLLVAEAMIAAEEIAPDFEPVEAPESQSLPLATNGKHTHEWSKANAALRATMSEYGLLGNAERPEQKQVRMACVSTWINRTIDSFCKMTPDEMYMVRDAIRRGDILPGWKIADGAAYLKPEQMAA
jgi:hypothetical protein